jgi:hypothetical protein
MLFIRIQIIFVLFLLIKDNLILRNLLTDQITHLNIDIKEIRESHSKIGSEIFAIILSLCKNLVVLNFCHVFSARNYWPRVSYLERGRCISSTLIKLKLNVSNLIDCLYLFDEPLACLSTLIINVSSIFQPFRYIMPTVSFISIIIFTQKEIIIFIFFVEKASQIEVFFAYFISLDK